MMEKIYKTTIELTSTDEAELSEMLYQMAEEIEYGIEKNKTAKHIQTATAEGHTTYERSERCSECKGVGEIATDEDDGEGHIMAGVGTRKCLCQS